MIQVNYLPGGLAIKVEGNPVEAVAIVGSSVESGTMTKETAKDILNGLKEEKVGKMVIDSIMEESSNDNAEIKTIQNVMKHGEDVKNV